MEKCLQLFGILKSNSGNSGNRKMASQNSFMIMSIVAMFSVATTFAQCATPPGNPSAYGSSSWIGYVYSGLDANNPPQNAFTTPYRGYITEPELFNQDYGTGAVSGANVCGSYNDSFSIRFRMQKNFAAGYYTITIGGDDGVRLSIDGGATFAMSDWNYHAYQTTTSTLFLSGNTNMVLETYDQGGEARVSFTYSYCAGYSTAPTSITGNSSICSGSSTILTATGGTAATGAAYQWGTGAVGSNVIAGQTAASITVSPTTNTTYWVRRIDSGTCSNTTSGATQLVSVTATSTAPTSITGTTTVCLGNSTILTASGGTFATGSIYEWGTGSTVGSNTIAGQTSGSITVTPTVSTTYWVRRINGAPCTTSTSGATATVTVNTPIGDQVSYGSNSWIGYVYATIDTANPPTNTFTTNYRGYLTQTEIFNQDIGSGSISGPNLCETYSDRFAIRFKMRRNFTTGYYTFTIGGDDGYRLSLDGGNTFPVSNWNDHAYASSTSATYYLSGSTDLVLEYYEQGGASQVSFNYVACTDFSTAPTSISGITSLCAGAGGTTLTATGGYAAAGATYQWGTGAVIGSNIVAGTTNSLYINPTATTTYWVRRVDGSPCNLITPGVTQSVTVSNQSTAPTSISNASTICSAGGVTLTALGGTASPGSSYQWGTGYSVGVNIISGENNATINVNPGAQTVYWVRRVDGAPCNTQTQGPTIVVSVPSTAPVSITGVNSLCYTSGGTTLTANGGTSATNAVFQWGTGSVIGSNVVSGSVNNLYINPSVTTTYWVRRYDPAPCNSYTGGVTFTVNVSTLSTSPTTISGNATICSGSSTTLTASGGTVGTGSVYQWGTGYTVGTNIISGESNATISVSPTIQTVYWVRRNDPAPCSAQTGGPTIQVNVTSPSTAPTAIAVSGSAGCPGTSRTLTASGGTAASGSVYQWGTGSTIGTNPITGQTGISITVTPSATTTYWVRRLDSGTCTAYTGGITAVVSVSPPPGDPTVFGQNSWIVYGYSTGDITLASAVYAGYYTQSTLGFDTTVSWNNYASPSSAANWQGCSVPVDNFTMVQKRQGFPCGSYTVTMQNWDDASELYIDGILKWSCTSYSGGGACSGNLGTFTLNSASTIEVRLREFGGASNAALSLVNTTVTPTAPTTISGITTICNGSGTTLTAIGGISGTNGVFEWGTGVIGTNIISGQNSASIGVSPSTATTYWVRRTESLCATTTAGISQSITVNPATIAGSLSSSVTTICRNTRPSNIALSGQTGSVVKWQYANDSAFTSGVTDIASNSPVLTPNDMGTLPATRYFRAVVQYGSCSVQYTAPIQISVPMAVTYSNGTWSGTPTATTPVNINSNLALATNLTVCSCQVNNGATLTIPSGVTLVVQEDVSVATTANIMIQNNGSLVQIDDVAANIGSITVKRNSTPMKQYDYSYWSAPVSGWKLNQLSPNTTPDKYYFFNPQINNWVSINGGNQNMDPAKGYIIRAPIGWSLTNSTQGIYQGTFTGVPNSGVIPVTIQKAAGTVNLIGNPYPSAIDIDLFLTDPTNRNIVNGTIYLWTHNTAISALTPGNAGYNYTSDDYAKYNLTGGVRTAATAITGGSVPTGKVASGEAFFIEANSASANGTYTANFKNSMRVINNNNQFFRINPGTNPSQNVVQKNRLWLTMSNTQGAYNEILVGYVTGATNGWDNLYDGKTFPSANVLSLYSISGSDSYSIQGRALPFDSSDVIPVGYKTTIAGNFTIALEDFDGFFGNQDVYLIDHLNNTSQNLKTAAYDFATETGTFNDRFEIRFINDTSLAVTQQHSGSNSVVMASHAKQIKIRSILPITAVVVYDLLGRKIYSADFLDSKEFSTVALSALNQVLIVKVRLNDNTEISQKVVLE